MNKQEPECTLDGYGFDIVPIENILSECDKQNMALFSLVPSPKVWSFYSFKINFDLN